MDSTKYQVIDRQTGKVVRTYANKNSARNARDRKDNAYGGYRFLVKAV